jgi:hypothetical protein
VAGERGSVFGEERRSQAIMAFLGAGLHQPPSLALAVTALADARRTVASLWSRGEPIAHWLASETRLHGIRENAATLAVMESTNTVTTPRRSTPGTTPTASMPSTTCWPSSPDYKQELILICRAACARKPGQ